MKPPQTPLKPLFSLVFLAAGLSACRETPPARSPAAPASASPVTAGPVSAAPASAAPASAAPASEAAPLPPGTEAQDAALAEGQTALAEGRPEAALRAFLAGSEGPVTGASVSAGLAAAALLEDQKRVDEAEALYLALQARAREVAEVQFVVGRFLAGRERTADAIAAFQAAIRLQPDFLPAYPLLSALLVGGGQRDVAAELLVDYERRLAARIRRVQTEGASDAERVAIVDLLAVLVDERAEEVLRGLLAAESPAVRMAAAGAVADQEEPAALVALAEALGRERDYTAQQVIRAALKRARDRAASTLP
ncbi:MAG: hypothetical protein H6706_21360 [Myxococcales bacterium]|nr:hypothetical protein [Myxococcales bacterium]